MANGDMVQETIAVSEQRNIHSSLTGLALYLRQINQTDAAQRLDRPISRI
jgi:hypothetical protein